MRRDGAGNWQAVVTAHTCRVLDPDCYRCSLNVDEMTPEPPKSFRTGVAQSAWRRGWAAGYEAALRAAASGSRPFHRQEYEGNWTPEEPPTLGRPEDG